MSSIDPPPTKSGSGRKALIWIGSILAVIGIGVFVYRMFFNQPKPPRWIVQKVARGEVLQVVSATGTLQPVLMSPVGAQVSGIVWKIHADYNNLVKKDQILVELDPALFQAAVRQQEANLAQAVASLAKARADFSNATLAAGRARVLAEKKYIALADRDAAVATEQSTRAAVLAAEANIKQTQASLDTVRLNLKNSVILSPVDGIVIARNVELGQAVVASFQAPNLFTIAQDLKKMQVLANVDETDIGHVRMGAVAEFSVDAFRGRKFRARVSQIRNAAQTVSNVVTYIVVLDVDNDDLALRPGMTANVRLEVARSRDALTIPAAALRFKPRLDQLVGGSEPGKPGGGRGGGRRWRREHGGEGSPDKAGDKPADKAGEKPGEKIADKAGEKPADKPGEKPADRPNEKAPDADVLDIEKGMPATVYLPRGELVEPVQITIGISDGMITEVKEGLTEGQPIVVDVARSPGGSSSGPPAGGAARPPGGGGGGFRRGGM